MSKKKFVIKINTDIESTISKTVNDQKSIDLVKKNYCDHVCDSIPLIIKSFKLTGCILNFIQDVLILELFVTQYFSV